MINLLNKIIITVKKPAVPDVLNVKVIIIFM